MKFKLTNAETGNIETFSVSELLKMLNLSTGWRYTMDSTLKEVMEAIEFFTEYTI